jgi:hypothetical protein
MLNGVVQNVVDLFGFFFLLWMIFFILIVDTSMQLTLIPNPRMPMTIEIKLLASII